MQGVVEEVEGAVVVERVEEVGGEAAAAEDLGRAGERGGAESGEEFELAFWTFGCGLGLVGYL